MGYVYIFSTYGEYGLESPIYATTDRSDLERILRDKCDGSPDEIAKLHELLKGPDEELCCKLRVNPKPPVWWNNLKPYTEWYTGQHALGPGWGALQLLVVKLESTK